MGARRGALVLVLVQFALGCGGRTEGLLDASDSGWGPSFGGATATGGAATGGRPAALGGSTASGGVGLGTGGAPPMSTPSLSTWYVFADGFGADGKSPGPCQTAGHPDSECSHVFKPTPSPAAFPYSGGLLCSAGIVARVAPDASGAPDYGNIWGAGIGLDFTINGVRTEFDAPAQRVIGISFTIDNVPSGLRIEFPTGSRDATAGGWDYWGAAPFYPPSPVSPGANKLLWDEVRGPQTGNFDPSRLTGIQFHVSTSPAFASMYSFCISNLMLIKG